MATPSANARASYERLTPVTERALAGERRWIGRCKRCGKTSKLEGILHHGWDPARHASDYVVIDRSGLAWTTADLGSNVSVVHGPCGDHRVALRRVVEGTKGSKHSCGAKCTSATGPNCDCRCRGANHGRDC